MDSTFGLEPRVCTVSRSTKSARQQEMIALCGPEFHLTEKDSMNRLQWKVKYRTFERPSQAIPDIILVDFESKTRCRLLVEFDPDLSFAPLGLWWPTLLLPRRRSQGS